MSGLRLLGHELRFQGLAFRRDPELVFFAVGLPLLYLVVFVSLFGGMEVSFPIEGQPGPLEASTVMLGNFMAIGVVSATLILLGVSVTQDREAGALRRLRGTPLPPAVFFGGQLAMAVLLGLAVAALLALLGRIAYGIPVPVSGLVPMALTLVVASAAFAALGLAFTILVRSARAVTPLVVGVTLTLFFLSGNFFLIEDWPSAMWTLAHVFPLKHVNDALLSALNPNLADGRFEWFNLAVITAWGAAGLLVALRWFRWMPRSG